ncbi:UDP-N-acetylmuramate dehydrogenase [Pontiellaceae bacterium B12227]|nr:UDP-N-acetylmuramate dehydrogenase [Pontiellaceae bacterium B12227]
MTIDQRIIEKLPAEARVELNACLRNYTTFKLGGPCPAVVMCPDGDTLTQAAQLFSEHRLPYIVIGQGSNLLVSDEGLDCIVLRYCSEEQPRVQQEGSRIRVSGNTLLDDLARSAIEFGLGDISYCSGIPGTVGGAIAGNAGAFGQQIGDVVESVRLMNSDGAIEEVRAETLDFKYRSSVLKQSGAIVLDAVLKLKPADIPPMMKERERIMELRRTKHPDWKQNPCAGSVFRNVEPSSAADRRQAAGWFLEEAGAKEFRVGGACLFDKHANIIITEPDASATDVFHLTEKMIAAVQKKFGFKLVREIKVLGPFS